MIKMKQYESVNNYTLVTGEPYIIRIRIQRPKSIEKALGQPFDTKFHIILTKVGAYLCKELGICQMGYVGLYEIVLLCSNSDYQGAGIWHKQRVSEIATFTTSICTAIFNQLISKSCYKRILDPKYEKLTLNTFFTAKVFSVPSYDVGLYFAWRQKGNIKQTITSLARYFFGDKTIKNMSNKEQQELLISKHKTNWCDLPTTVYCGCCIFREKDKWKIDNETPLFIKNADYLKKHLTN